MLLEREGAELHRVTGGVSSEPAAQTFNFNDQKNIGSCEHVCVSKHVNNSYKHVSISAGFMMVDLAERRNNRRDNVLFHVYETRFACPSSKTSQI